MPIKKITRVLLQMKNFISLGLALFFCMQFSFGQDLAQHQQTIDYYISQAKLDSARIYIQNTLSQTSTNKSALNYQLAKVLFMQSSYDEALLHSFSSLDEVKNKDEKVKFNFLIGCIYSAIADYGKSIEYFDLVIDNCQDSSLAVKTYLMLNSMHVELGDELNAKRSISEAYEISKHSTLNEQIKEHVAMQFSYSTGDYALCKALNNAVINDSSRFLNSRSFAYSMIGDCLVKQDSLNKASTFYHTFLELTVETKDPEQIKVAANKLIELYEKLGDQEKANAYHKIYNEALSDSVSFSLEKYRDIYTIEKNRELKTIESKNARRNLFFGTGMFLLAAIGLYLYFKNKRKEKESKDKKENSGRKIVVSESEIKKIVFAIEELKAKQLFLTPNITRKSFCENNGIKSERYLSHYINENDRMSFSVFINDLRVEYAHYRILNDKIFRNYKVEEIAKACGFGSKKSFERAFSAKYKETPFRLIESISD